jgi:hypothetical protein
VASNRLFNNPTWLNPFSGEFKSMKSMTNTHGMGDYTGALERGLQGGYLFVVWAQPVAIEQAGVTCTACQGTEYSLRILGTRVLP